MKSSLYIFILIAMLGTNASTQKYRDSTLLISEIMIHFDSDRSDIHPSDTFLLNDLVHLVNGSYFIQIKTHTDDMGSNQYNELLSEKRALSIRQYFISRGIPAHRISSKFFGETRPLERGHSRSNRRMNRRGVIQLYKEYRFFVLRGQVTDDKNNMIPNALISLRSKIASTETRSDELGQFKIWAPVNLGLSIAATAKGHFYTSVNISAKKQLSLPKVLISLPKLETDKKFSIDHLLFLGHHSNILAGSLDELQKLKNTLLINHDLCIEIAGHVNVPNTGLVNIWSFEYELSVARALIVYDSLLAIGISPDRMYANGYGNWQMLFPKTNNPKEMQKNRRVEIIVKDCEKVRNTENEYIQSDHEFYLDPLHLKFRKRDINTYMILFSRTEQKKIIHHLKYLKSKDIDPANYTYGQLLLDPFPKQP